MVGAGKTTRAREISSARHAVLITPDEWMIPLFGRDFRNDEYPRRRDIVEGLLISMALDILRVGVSVVLDFGCWAKNERSALRFLAESVGAICEVVYVPLSTHDQVRRVTERWEASPQSQFPITEKDLAKWAHLFEVPTTEELEGGPLDPPPEGANDWAHWASDRWPSFVV
jgi:predicted kinase